MKIKKRVYVGLLAVALPVLGTGASRLHRTVLMVNIVLRLLHKSIN
jgi:hypothetical protein